MARPKKAKALRRTHPVMLRFTDTEYERLLSHAEAAGLPLAEYIRKQVTGKQVKVKYEIVADLPELKKLIAEFGKIGGNPLPLSGKCFWSERRLLPWQS